MFVKKIVSLQTGILIFCFWPVVFHLSAQARVAQSFKELRTCDLRAIAIQDATSVNRWWWGWLGGYSAATVGQGIAGLTADKLSFRQDMFLSAATTLAGAAGQLISPVRPVKFRKWREFENSTVAEPTRQDEYLKYLEKMAVAEKKGRGWSLHLASGAVNLTSGLVTWLGFKRSWKDGLVNFAINTVVTEAQIWSQPVKAKRFLSKYGKAGSVAAFSQDFRSTGTILSVSSGAGGISLRWIF